MNRNISRLVEISNKQSRNIIGLMSGTSLDGLDVVVCEVKGNGFETALSIKEFSTIPYTDDFKNEVRSIFSKQQIDLQQLCLMNEWIGTRHADIVNHCLDIWKINKDDIDLIASHGQTIYHAPASFHQIEKYGNATLQVGDADHIAVKTGIITISDFRQKHIAAGGEGAPLAVYGDLLLFSKSGEDRIMLNIGGIANFTWLPGSRNTSEVFSSDTGPGNTLMDALMQQEFEGKYFDEGSMIAMKGKISEPLLKALKDHEFFELPFPKTTGPELFNLSYLHSAKERSLTTSLPVEDTMCTLNRFTADSIVSTIQHCFKDSTGIKLFCSGGGINNTLLMQQLEAQLPNCSMHTTESLGIIPDAKEAVLFAVLANECICGNPSIFTDGVKGMPATTMGKVSFPG